MTKHDHLVLRPLKLAYEGNVERVGKRARRALNFYKQSFWWKTQMPGETQLVNIVLMRSQMQTSPPLGVSLEAICMASGKDACYSCVLRIRVRLHSLNRLIS